MSDANREPESHDEMHIAIFSIKKLVSGTFARTSDFSFGIILH